MSSEDQHQEWMHVSSIVRVPPQQSLTIHLDSSEQPAETVHLMWEVNCIT